MAPTLYGKEHIFISFDNDSLGCCLLIDRQKVCKRTKNKKYSFKMSCGTAPRLDSH